MPHVVELEPSYETGYPGLHLVDGDRVQFFQTVGLSPNEERRLCDLRSLESRGQKEIGFCGSIIVKTTVKASALELANIVGDVVLLRPWRQWVGRRPMKAA